MKHSPEFTKLCQDAARRVDEIEPAQVNDLLQQDNCPVIIDVREQAEFTRSHLPKAKHLSRGIIEIHIHKLANKDTPIILYCGGGNRSLLAGDNLLKMGYSNVQSMTGGFRGWVNNSYPVASDDQQG